MTHRRIISVHGAAGAGKTTLLKVIGEYFQNVNCIVKIESIDHLWQTKSYRRRRSSLQIFSTTMTASKKIVRTNTQNITFLVLILILSIFSIITQRYLLTIATFLLLCIPFITQLMASHLLSKLWNYYSDHYIKSKEEAHHQLDINSNENGINWAWFDRNCVDIYGFCCIDQPVVVPTDFIDILKTQTADTNVAIFVDTPSDIICRHLAARICGPNSSRRMRIVTQLLIKIPFMIQTTLQALDYVEKWYHTFNVPVIKISQLYDRLDKDNETQEIIWTKNSIEILLQEIEKVISNRQSVTEQQEEDQKQLLAPWLLKIRKHDNVH